MPATIAALGERALRRLGVAVVAAADRPEMLTVNSYVQIAGRALVWLGVVASDETPEATDTATAEEKALNVHDSLVAQGFVSWDENSIPRGVSDDYVMLTALRLGMAFGKTLDGAQMPVIEARIKRFAMIARAPALAQQAVMDVHANLDARGLTRWSVFDIPDYIENPYILMAANLLAPQFDLPADPAAEARATRELAQVIALGTSGERVVAEYF